MTASSHRNLTACSTVGQALTALAAMFREAGLPDGATDARLLACAAFRMTRLDLTLRPDARADEASLTRLCAFAESRLRREPVTRILGTRGFWNLELHVHANVLDPRPDSEALVEVCLEALEGRRAERLHVLDVGTGSGALLAALLSELPNSHGWGIDISASAAAAAHSNINKLGLEKRAAILNQSWAAPLPTTFDLVVSNPPYIETAAISGLDPEVRDHDPHLALDGGADGLDAYRAIARHRKAWMREGGLLALEIGSTQARQVGAIFKEAGMHLLALRQDYAGLDRVTLWAEGAC